MASKRTTTAPKPEPKPGLVPAQFRFPPELLTELDRWTEDMNAERTWPKLTRTDLVRGVLAWAAKTRPKWERKA